MWRGGNEKFAPPFRKHSISFSKLLDNSHRSCAPRGNRTRGRFGTNPNKSLRGRLLAPSRLRPPLDPRLRPWEPGVVARAPPCPLARRFDRPSTPVSARGRRESMLGRLPAPSLAASTAPRLPSPRVGDGSRCAGDSPLPRWPIRPPLDSCHRTWETGVVARAIPRSLAAAPTALRPPSLRVGDRSRCASDSPLARGGSDRRPSTPVSARGRRESLRERLPARSRRLRLPPYSRLRSWETGVVARATPRSLAAASDRPPTPVSTRGRRESLGGRLLARSRRHPTVPLLPSPRVGDGSRCAGDSSLPRGGSDCPSTPVSVCGRRESLAGQPSIPSAVVLADYRLPSSREGDGSRGSVKRHAA